MGMNRHIFIILVQVVLAEGFGVSLDSIENLPPSLWRIFAPMRSQRKFNIARLPGDLWGNVPPASRPESATTTREGGRGKQSSHVSPTVLAAGLDPKHHERPSPRVLLSTSAPFHERSLPETQALPQWVKQAMTFPRQRKASSRAKRREPPPHEEARKRVTAAPTRRHETCEPIPLFLNRCAI